MIMERTKTEALTNELKMKIIVRNSFWIVQPYDLKKKIGSHSNMIDLIDTGNIMQPLKKLSWWIVYLHKSI